MIISKFGEDQKDAQWIARLAEMGLLRPSFVPPPEIRALRDLTRTRLQLLKDRTREWQRLEKLLEGALAGPRTERATLAVCSDPGCLHLGQIIQADLERIGLHIQIRSYAGAIASATSQPGADIVLARVFAPYPDPVAFLKTALGGRFAQDRLDNLTRLDRSQRLTAAG
jgi:transposase